MSRRAEGAHPAAQLQYGTCLVTDARNYTALAERLSPQELQRALNAYYAVLFPEIEQRGGFVADVVGDSMVAIWATPEPDASARLSACRAALAIEQATQAFNRANTDFQFPTRIGIHTGRILLGNIGTDSHLEYRAIGDIVNTASRIQDLNKQLGTTLLVSEDVLQDPGPVAFRRLGEFLLAGKEVPIRLCDRISLATTADAEQAALSASFDEAHRLFLARRWSEAAAAYEELLARFAADGPSEFYLRLCRRYAVQDPGPAWTGTVATALP
jgi:adenylate cyclase